MLSIELFIASSTNIKSAVEHAAAPEFENIIGQVVERVLRENNAFLSDEIGYKVSDKVVKEMDYHMRVREEIEEERFKKLDETIRSFQKSKKEKKKLKLRK